ncbi:6344_t:CDS:10, partial [Diversispora eburnea]
MDNQYVIKDSRILVLLDRATDSQKDQQLRVEALISLQQLIENEKQLLEFGLLEKISVLIKDSISEIREWTIDFFECENQHDASSLWNIATFIKIHIMRFFDSDDTKQGIKISAIKFLQVVSTVQSRHVRPEEDISLSLCPQSHPILNAFALEKEAISIINGLYSLLNKESSNVITAIINALGPVFRSRPQYIYPLVNIVLKWKKNPPTHLSELQLRSVKKTIKIQLMTILRIPLFESLPFINEVFDAIIILGGRNDPMKFPRQFRRLLYQKEGIEDGFRTSGQRRNRNNGNNGLSFDPTQFSIPFVVDVIHYALQAIPQERLLQAKQTLQQREANMATRNLLTPQTSQQTNIKQTREERKVRDPRLEFQRESTPKSPSPPPVVKSEEEEEIIFMSTETSETPETKEPVKPEIKYEYDDDMEIEEFFPEKNIVPEEHDEMEITEDSEKVESISEDDENDENEQSEIQEDQLEDLEFESEDQDLPPATPTFKFQPYVLPPPENLPEEQCQTFIKTVLVNILEIESKLSTEVKGTRSNVVLTTLSNGKRLTRTQLHVMAVRLLTRGLEFPNEATEKTNNELREIVVQHILEDFKNRMDFALTWLDEEWYHDIVRQRVDPSHKSNYVIWISRLLDRIIPALEDRVLSQFLLDVPELVEDIVDRIKIFCNDPDRRMLGFSTLSELIDLRPPARSFCMKILLAYCLHRDESTRTSAITVVNKWYPNHSEISQTIELFALESLRQICHEIPPTLFDYHYHVGGVDDTKEIITKDDELETRKWAQQDVDRHIDLFLSLCSKKNELFNELISAYIRTPEPIQVMIRKNAQKIIDTIGLNGLIQLFRTFPNGAEDFVLKIQLTNTVKSVITQRNLDGRFLFPIISYFEKVRIVSTLDATEKQRDIVKKVFLKIVTPTNGVTPITPSELLVSLHQMDVPLKQSVEAIHTCFTLANIFNQQILGAVLQHLSVQSELPMTFMRTVTLSVRAHNALAGFVNDLLIRKVTDIWKNEVLRKGFILYCTEFCLKIKPNNFKFLLQLPQTQIQDILKQRDQTLSKALKRYVDNLKPEQRRGIPQYLLEILET